MTASHQLGTGNRGVGEAAGLDSSTWTLTVKSFYPVEGPNLLSQARTFFTAPQSHAHLTSVITLLLLGDPGGQRCVFILEAKSAFWISQLLVGDGPGFQK